MLLRKCQGKQLTPAPLPAFSLPLLKNRLSMDRIYLDNAASTPMAPAVLEAMQPYLLGHPGNPSSTHAPGRALRNALEEARRRIAKHLGAQPGEIYFTSGGTEADNLALLGAVQQYQPTHALTTHLEHHAVLYPLEQLEAAGKLKLHFLPTDEQGHIDLDELRSFLQQHPHTLVSLMHGNNEIGTLHPLQEVAEICQETGAIFHSDTVQTMGHFDFDLGQCPLDFATASAHKFYGPRGTGLLYVRKGRKLPALMTGGGQERDLRPGTENVPGIVGMAAALDLCYADLAAKNAHLRGLKQYLIEQLREIFPGLRINGDASPAHSLPTVLNVTFPCGEDDAMLLFHLDLAGIAASGGSACSSGALMGSHVLRGLGGDLETLTNSIRFSFGPDNTQAELDTLLAKLKEIMPAHAV
jgi:cysteine desulfurase